MAVTETKSHLGQLVVWTHTPSKKPKARAIVVHGMGEHSARHRNTVAALVKAGYEVIRFDFRGSGESGGARQYIEHFEDYVADLVKVYLWTTEKTPALPLFVIGHSLGGTVSLRFASRYSQELTGLCLSAPAFRPGDAVSPLKITVGRLLSGWLPSMKIPKTTDIRAVSRDPKVIEDYQNDKLACRFNTLRQGAAILDTFNSLLEAVSKITCPTILFHGTSDTIIKPEGSFEILRSLPGVSAKELFLLPNNFHEPHNDIEKEKYFELLVDWLDQKTTGARPTKTTTRRTKNEADVTSAKV